MKINMTITETDLQYIWELASKTGKGRFYHDNLIEDKYNLYAYNLGKEYKDLYHFHDINSPLVDFECFYQNPRSDNEYRLIFEAILITKSKYESDEVVKKLLSVIRKYDYYMRITPFFFFKAGLLYNEKSWLETVDFPEPKYPRESIIWSDEDADSAYEGYSTTYLGID